MTQTIRDLRGVLIPISSTQLLLPASSVMEVISYSDPEAFANQPDWLLGSIHWQSAQVPIISYATLLQRTDMESVSKAKIMVIKSLLEETRLPYLGLLVQGLPRKIKIEVEELEHLEDTNPSFTEYSHVKVDGKSAIIPDLDRLAQVTVHAAYGALPITSLD